MTIHCFKPNGDEMAHDFDQVKVPIKVIIQKYYEKFASQSFD